MSIVQDKRVLRAMRKLQLSNEQIEGTERCPAPTVVCSHCQGGGFVELSQAYARTYYLTSTGWESTEVQHARHRDGVRRTTLIGRLNELVRLGLVERRRDGKTVQWRRR